MKQVLIAGLSLAMGGAAYVAPLEFGSLSRECRVGLAPFVLNYTTPENYTIYYHRRPAYDLALLEFERVLAYSVADKRDQGWHPSDLAALSAEYWVVHCPIISGGEGNIDKALDDLAVGSEQVSQLRELLRLEAAIDQASSLASLQALAQEAADLAAAHEAPGDVSVSSLYQDNAAIALALTQALLKHRIAIRSSIASGNAASGAEDIDDLVKDAARLAELYPQFSDRIAYAFNYEAALAWLDLSERLGDQPLGARDLTMVYEQFFQGLPITLEQFLRTHKSDWNAMGPGLAFQHAMRAEQSTYMSRSSFEVFMSLDIVGSIEPYVERRGSIRLVGGGPRLQQIYCRKKDLAARVAGRRLAENPICANPKTSGPSD